MKIRIDDLDARVACALAAALMIAATALALWSAAGGLGEW